MALAPFNVDLLGKFNVIVGPRCGGKTTLLYDLLSQERKKDDKLIFLFSYFLSEWSDLPRDFVQKRLFRPDLTTEYLLKIETWQNARIERALKRWNVSRNDCTDRIFKERGIILAFDDYGSNARQAISRLYSNRRELGITFYFCVQDLQEFNFAYNPELIFDLHDLYLQQSYASTVLRNHSLHFASDLRREFHYCAQKWHSFDEFMRLLGLTWQEVHQVAYEVGTGFSFILPVYVLLNVVDFLPKFAAIPEWKKVYSLQYVEKSMLRYRKCE